MTWEVYGTPYYNDSDLTDTTVKQSMIFDTAVLLRAVRVGIILVGDPTFTSMNMKIYNSALTVALYTSTNVQTKAQLLTTEDNGICETWFEFNDVMLARGDTYYFVLNATGYSGASESSHIAWMSTYPKSIHPTDADTRAELEAYPLHLYAYTSRFDTP